MDTFIQPRDVGEGRSHEHQNTSDSTQTTPKATQKASTLFLLLHPPEGGPYLPGALHTVTSIKITRYWASETVQEIKALATKAPDPTQVEEEHQPPKVVL